MTDDPDELKARIRDLEAALGLTDTSLVKLQLSPALSQVLGLLMALPHVTSEMIEGRLGIATSARVIMHRLRDRLKPHNVVIHSRHFAGYWLDEQGKATIRRLTQTNDTKTAA